MQDRETEWRMKYQALEQQLLDEKLVVAKAEAKISYLEDEIKEKEHEIKAAKAMEAQPKNPMTDALPLNEVGLMIKTVQDNHLVANKIASLEAQVKGNLFIYSY